MIGMRSSATNNQSYMLVAVNMVVRQQWRNTILLLDVWMRQAGEKCQEKIATKSPSN